MQKTKIAGYIATNTGTGEALPIAPTFEEAMHSAMSKSLDMLNERDLNAFKIWEINIASAVIETEEDTPYDVAAMMATVAGAWEERDTALVFAISSAQTLDYRPFASDCAKTNPNQKTENE